MRARGDGLGATGVRRAAGTDRRRLVFRCIWTPLLVFPAKAGTYGRNAAGGSEGAIEIAPIAYMRGRTLNNAFIVIDEAQNCTYGQIKMLLTRLGWHSTMVLTGDPDQSDLLDGLSGLPDIARRLDAIPGIAVIRLNDRDIVRHPLVGEMLTVL